MKSLFSILLITFLAACSPYERDIQSLGANSSFNDVSIPDDFEAPEDEVLDNIVITPPEEIVEPPEICLLYTSPSPRDS